MSVALALLVSVQAAGCCTPKPTKEIMARRQRCQGNGMPLGDGKCHQCPAGTTLHEKIEEYRSEPDDWEVNNAFSSRQFANDTGHGSIGRGSGSGRGGPLFPEHTFSDLAWCADAQGKRQGPSGKWVLGAKGSKEPPTLLAWGSYKDNLRDGPWSERNGEERGSYAAGKREGRWALGTGAGGEYRAGKREGAWKEYGDEGGYRAGKRVGPWSIEIELLSRKWRATGRFDDGKPTGPWTLRQGDEELTGSFVLLGAESHKEDYSASIGLTQVGLWLQKQKGQAVGATCHSTKNPGEQLWSDDTGKRRDCPST